MKQPYGSVYTEASGHDLEERPPSSSKGATSGSLQLGSIPGKPVGHNYGLLSMNYGLLEVVVVHCFGVLCFPGTDSPN